MSRGRDQDLRNNQRVAANLGLLLLFRKKGLLIRFVTSGGCPYGALKGDHKRQTVFLFNLENFETA